MLDTSNLKQSPNIHLSPWLSKVSRNGPQGQYTHKSDWLRKEPGKRASQSDKEHPWVKLYLIVKYYNLSQRLGTKDGCLITFFLIC